MVLIDRYTLLRQMGYFGSLAEMEAKYLKNTSGLDTIGEQIGKALDGQMARQMLLPEQLSYTYNPDGSVATETADGGVTTYTYNTNGTIATETCAGRTYTYTYDATGLNIVGVNS